METLGKRLRRLRSQRKLTLQEVASQIPVPTSTYKEWEYGRAIQGEPYTRLAEIFGVSLAELMTGKQSSQQFQILLNRIQKARELLTEVEVELRSLF